MSKNLELKKQAVAEIVEKIQGAKSLVIVEYKGLTVEEVTQLRAKCRAAKVDYCVLKNTLVRRALAELNITGLPGRRARGAGTPHFLQEFAAVACRELSVCAARFALTIALKTDGR